jgi:hypothetical protein
MGAQENQQIQNTTKVLSLNFPVPVIQRQGWRDAGPPQGLDIRCRMG